jgi:hypothetical protein
VFLKDLAGSLLAAVLYIPLLFIPGYALARRWNLLEFNHLDGWGRLGAAVALSVSCVPIPLYFATALEPKTGGWVLAGAILLWFALDRRYNRAGAHGRTVSAKMAMAALAATAGFFALTLVDLPWAGGLISSYCFTEADYVKHVAVTDAIARTGVAPANPFFYPGHPVPLFYYYFWHLICSWIVRFSLGGVNGRDAIIGSLPWAAFALVGITLLYARKFAPLVAAERPVRRLALALLCVSGLDIIPVAAIDALHVFTGRMWWIVHVERWNVQVTSWLASMTWVPQHIAGLTSNLCAILLLRVWSEKGPDLRPRSIMPGMELVFAALAFASGAGYSVWVTAVSAVSVCGWVIACWIRGAKREALAFVAAGLFAALLAAPWILELEQAQQIHLFPVQAQIRGFSPIWHFVRRMGPAGINAALLAALPLNYLLELGFFGLAAVYGFRQYWRRQPRQLTQYELLAVIVTSCSLLIPGLFSSVMGSNDLGYRGVLPAQFFLLQIGAVWLYRRRGAQTGKRRLSFIVPLFLIIGATTTAADWVGTRFYPLIPDPRLHVTSAQTHLELALRLEVREAWEFVRSHTGSSAVVQHNPATDLAIAWGLYGERQVAAADRFHGPLFGIAPDAYRVIERRLDPLFRPGLSWVRTKAVCREYGISALVVEDRDVVWGDEHSWIWKRDPEFAGKRVRVFFIH